jgi:transposase
MRRIREILRYRFEGGLSLERIAGALGVSKGVVYHVVSRFSAAALTWPLPEELSDTALEEALYGPKAAGRRSENADLPPVEYLEKQLARRHVTLQLLFEEYRAQHPQGLGRSQFYEYFAQQRPRRLEMKVVEKGGDRLYVDYAGDRPEFVDRQTGEVVLAQLFVCSWGASSFSYTEASLTLGQEDMARSQVRAFDYFGVAPWALVPDNTKSAVHEPCRYDPEMNVMYRSMAQHYGCVVLPARVCTPEDKAIVESNVLQVERYILARLRDRVFYGLHELNTAIWELLEPYNDRPMKDYGNQSRRQRFEELDKPFARALPARKFVIARIAEGVRVAPNYHVRYLDHYYSVPHQYARRRVDIHQSGQTIEIYHDHVHLCRHQLSNRKYGYTTDAGHMPPEHAFVKGWSKDYFIGEAGKVGAAAAESVKLIMERQEHVQQGFNAALGVLRLAKVYGHQRLELACARALHFRTPSYRSLKAILEQHLEAEPLEELQASPTSSVAAHENIRGAQYYECAANLSQEQ